jgi:succinate-semialdehyde dehydrogenase / glutarate-semialdehyde dehydrogenase
VYEAVGVVVAFVAWNFPLLNLGFKLGPAMAAGCPLIVRPSSETPLSAYVLGEICEDVGLPPGVVNILAGPADSVADTLSRSPVPALLTLIGSTETGRKIIAAGATSIKRFSMELGGNAPVLVYDDADVERAADGIAALKFGNAGQICVTPNRVFADARIMDALAEALLARARRVKLGFGRDSGATMGPVINHAARDRIHSWVTEAVSRGAQLVCGGRPPGALSKGSWYEPTILRNVREDMPVSCREVFGPVISLIPFDDESRLIARANDTEAGLTAYVYSRSAARIQRASRELRFGEVMVNGFRWNIDLPHGGIGQSGVGHDCSHLALHDYLARKRITTSLA